MNETISRAAVDPTETVRFVDGPTIMLRSGRYMDLLNPSACAFNVNDIAHALSNLTRFTGQCTDFYSVAQHGLALSHMVPRKDALAALMSDAASAFVGDVVKPLKRLMPRYKGIEDAVRRAVFNRLGLPMESSAAMRAAKAELLEIERSCVQTECGRVFDFDRPGQCDFDIYDIANALANTCRFTGHCGHFYSVAQHCVLVSQVVAPEEALMGLMHDSPEAFVGDVAKPLKILLPDYSVIEDRVEEAVFERFGIPKKLPPTIKAGDIVLLRTEQRDIMQAESHIWGFAAGAKPMADRIQPLSPAAAREAFLVRYEELTGSKAPRRALKPAIAGAQQGAQIAPMIPTIARQAFLARYLELTGR